MGIWNSHTSVGNILGAIIPGFFAEHEWGWSFVVPGIIIAVLGLIVFMFLVPSKCFALLVEYFPVVPERFYMLVC